MRVVADVSMLFFCSHLPDHPEYQAGLVMTSPQGAFLPVYPWSISRWYPGCSSPLPRVHLSWVPCQPHPLVLPYDSAKHSNTN